MPDEKECCRHNVPFNKPCGHCLREIVVRIQQMSIPSALIDGLAGIWSKSLPTEQGWYWWWNEDPDDVPVPVSILASGMDGRCFASKGQFGWTRHQYVEEMGGWWMRLIEPELPAC